MKNSHIYTITNLFAAFLLLVGCSKEKRSTRAGQKMQTFVIELSAYAKSKNSNFKIIPQNGLELLFQNLDAEDAINQSFIQAIDGFGVEELFYNGNYTPDDYRINMANWVKNTIPIFVADYVTSNSDIAQAFQLNTNYGFKAFPRQSLNYDYQFIPDSCYHENATSITTLAQAQNYLYLISNNAFLTKESYLTAIQQTNFDVVIIDGFYGDALLTSSEVTSLKTKANGASRLVISYMNVGAAEKYRYYWQSDWKLKKPNWLAKEYDGYSDEIWVKYWKKDWKNIIYGNDDSYTKKLIDAGFDGAYLDNVEAFYFLYFDE